jgi:ABC-2 type transport system ATP-binding protein
MIEIQGLVKSFGPFVAVDGLSFSVARGEVMGFLGPNGAGKSTTMKMITGYLAPTAGRVIVCGHDVAAEPLAAKKRIGYLPEGAPAYPDMTPRAFLEFIADVRNLAGDARRRAIRDAVEKVEIGGVLEQPIETLSKGFKRRVGLAQAILHDPEVLILDEPTDGLDPNQKHQVRTLIRDMAARKAIIISTHILEEVDAVCSRALIIDRGRIVADGTPAELEAMSRHHNSVSLVLARPQAGAAEALSRLAGVDRIEAEDAEDRAWRVYPKEGRPIVAEVGELARLNGWAVDRLVAEPGRLDEVFRRLTTSDTRRAEARTGAEAA